jgi:hypothetical protein
MRGKHSCLNFGKSLFDRALDILEEILRSFLKIISANVGIAPENGLQNVSSTFFPVNLSRPSFHCMISKYSLEKT